MLIDDDRIAAIGRHPFRARFRLRCRDRAIVQLRGIRKHAEELFATRVAPANPPKDGRQTPYRGHPVFVAQHATATCCRTCLKRWHEIRKGHELDADQQAYAVDVICRWGSSSSSTPEAAGCRHAGGPARR
jgi:hypothetical protein